MGKPEPTSDPLAADLDEAHRLYLLCAARVPPGQGQDGGRRTPPASRPPLQVDMVSAMAELEDYLGKWNAYVRWLLEPSGKIDLTAREGVRCPYCQGSLVAYLRTQDPDAAEIVCTNLNHPDTDGPRRWAWRDWPRLGVLAGVRDDARYGPKLQVVAET